DDAVADPVSPHCPVQDNTQSRQRHRQADAQLRERSHQACHMPALVNEAALPHLAHLVNAVGKLKAAILHADESVAMGPVTAIHIGNPGHGKSFVEGRVGPPSVAAPVVPAPTSLLCPGPTVGAGRMAWAKAHDVLCLATPL